MGGTRRGRARRGRPGAGRRPSLWWLLVPAVAAVLLAAWRHPELPGTPVLGWEPCVPADGRFLGIHDGRVTVFEGVPGRCSAVLQELGLDAADLPPFQREALEAGIPFGSETERLQIMEGLESGVSK